ncbi:MAG: folylpolyglutamate synthase/dihydrofolate synthase family protein [Alphaproteobacteria bacterium]
MTEARENSVAMLARLEAEFPKLDISLRPAYYDLLNALGSPQEHLPPVIHVAGTNGKGSTCAFLRAMLEAAGKRVHVYTSPHLVDFNERIRLAGKLIGENELVAILAEAEAKAKAASGAVSFFELITAAALAAFARTPADFLVMETGLGGRRDSTNVVAKPIATAITRISFDHRDYLGKTLADIAMEKAGIMKEGVPCLIGHQTADIEPVFAAEAQKIRAPLLRFGREWRVDPSGSKAFRYADRLGTLELPLPGLLGAHQIANASLALAILRLGAGEKISDHAIADGLQKVEWPARLQRLKSGPLIDLIPKNWELWLDGGHNDSAGEVLAIQAEDWKHRDGARPKPLFIVYGMLNSKNPQEFLAPLASHAAALRAVTIPGEPNSLTLRDAVAAAAAAGIHDPAPALDMRQAVQDLSRQSAAAARLLICGSLHLAGEVLRHHK